MMLGLPSLVAIPTNIMKSMILCATGEKSLISGKAIFFLTSDIRGFRDGSAEITGQTSIVKWNLDPFIHSKEPPLLFFFLYSLLSLSFIQQ
jgi:hypothetical protein